MSADCRRTRKSAPVKNAIFLGAIHKDKLRMRGMRELKDLNILAQSSKPQPATKTRDNSFNSADFNSSNDTRRNPRRTFPSSSSVRMSTPVRNVDQSPRYCTRNRSKQSESSPDRSQSIVSSIGGKRRFHPDYDPFIEIRRAKERLDRFRRKDDWNADILLSDDADEDLCRYEEKLKRRQAERGELMEPIELERRQLELLRRQRDIDMGKVTDRYAEYVLTIPKPMRERHHPRTPNKFRKVSRRAWDGMIRKWRKHLHNFDDLSFEGSWRSLSSTYMSGQSTPSHSFSGMSSDCENDVTHSDCPKLTAEASVCRAGDIIASQNSPTVRRAAHSTKFQSVQIRPPDEEEETLQAHPKAFRGEVAHSLLPQLDDEDTLSAMPTFTNSAAGNRRQVTRSLRSRQSPGPAPDALHSGLTSDMTDLYRRTSGQKRTSSHFVQSNASVDITNLTDFPHLKADSSPALTSPSKRSRRGILSENGINQPGTSLF